MDNAFIQSELASHLLNPVTNCTVAANNLSPQKAAILLRLALTKDINQEYLEELYLQY